MDACRLGENKRSVWHTQVKIDVCTELELEDVSILFFD